MNKTSTGGNGLAIMIALLFLFAFGTAGIIIIITSIKGRANCSQYTEGIVIENSRQYSNGKHKYRPVVQFEANGEVVTVKSKLASSPKAFDEGDKVIIYYNPDNVNQIQIKGYESNTFTFMGVIFIVIGLAIPTMILYSLKKQN